VKQERFALGETLSTQAGPLPRVIEPMLAVLGGEPFDSPRHIFEVKWDGVRIVAFLSGGRVRFQDRYGRDVTDRYPELAGLGRQVGGSDTVLDGEIVVLDEQGRPDFSRLQLRLAADAATTSRLSGEAPVTYQTFDVLYKDGRSIMAYPLWRRKNLLHQIVRPGEFIRTPDFVEREGIAFFEAAREHDLEGIIAKERESVYRAGQRSPAWLKVKVYHKEEFVVGGCTLGGGRGKQPLQSLLLGAHDPQGRLVYVGEVTVAEPAAGEALPALDSLQSPQCPFPDAPRLARLIFWCRPELVATVRFGEWTAEGRLRFAVFEGLRPDVPPASCLLEAVAGG